MHAHLGAKLQGGGSIRGRGTKAMYPGGSPPPRMSSADCRAAKPSIVLELRKLHGQVPAGRNLRPSVISPVVTSRHRAMSSLRASATIMVLRVVRRPSAVGPREPPAGPASLWENQKSPARWVSPRGGPAAPGRGHALSPPRAPPPEAEHSERGFDPIDGPCRLGHQALPLAAWPTRVFFRHGRDRDHAAMALLATQPAEKRAHQQFRVDPVGLGPPVLAGHRDARRMDDVGLDGASL